MNIPARHPSNEAVSAATHLAGFGFAIFGLVLLLQRAALSADPWSISSLAIFGATLVLIYGISTVYHSWPVEHSRKEFLRRLDHAAIYFFIAGTYTPITLVPLRGAWGWSIFGIVWVAALFGCLIKLGGWELKRSFSSLIYLVLGWLVLLAIMPLVQAVSWEGFKWLFIGGVMYSVGVVFFALEVIVRPRQWFGMHEVFHLFVLAGSFLHWWFMYEYIATL